MQFTRGLLRTLHVHAECSQSGTARGSASSGEALDAHCAHGALSWRGTCDNCRVRVVCCGLPRAWHLYIWLASRGEPCFRDCFQRGCCARTSRSLRHGRAACRVKWAAASSCHQFDCGRGKRSRGLSRVVAHRKLPRPRCYCPNNKLRARGFLRGRV